MKTDFMKFTSHAKNQKKWCQANVHIEHISNASLKNVVWQTCLYSEFEHVPSDKFNRLEEKSSLAHKVQKWAA